MTRQIIIILSLLLFISCSGYNVEYFKNNKNNKVKIPIIEKDIGNKKVLFIVDSGANLSVIDSTWYFNNSDLFRKEGEETSTIITGISGTSNLKTILVSTIIDGRHILFSTSDLSPIIKDLETQGFNIVGILGSDYLRDNYSIIDYKKQAVYSAKRWNKIW